jgi:hypothetical protein
MPRDGNRYKYLSWPVTSAYSIGICVLGKADSATRTVDSSDTLYVVQSILVNQPSPWQPRGSGYL